MLRSVSSSMLMKPVVAITSSSFSLANLRASAPNRLSPTPSLHAIISTHTLTLSFSITAFSNAANTSVICNRSAIAINS
jgi:hypothetical protein